MTPPTITVVPCRTASARLPRKALALIHGVPAIERCLLNTLAIERSNATVLATTTSPEDDVLAGHTLGSRVDLIRGSTDDVLERFLAAIKRHDAELVIRVTGDCPVNSYELADLLVESHLASGADVTLPGPGFPSGINSEVYSASALLRLRQLAPRTPCSEYLIMYFLNNPTLFHLNEMLLPNRFRRDWRLTLDEQSDLDLFELLFATLEVGGEPLSWEAIVGFFAGRPEAAQINAAKRSRYTEEFMAQLTAATTLPI